jgi:phosphatidate cytidylyltransferase
MRSISKNFKHRLLFSLFFSLFLLGTIYFSSYPLFQPFFALITAGIISMALWEFYSLTKAHGYSPQTVLGVLCTFAYIFSLYLNFLKPMHNALPEAVLGIALVFSFLYFFVRGSSPLVNLAITFFGVFYLTIPLGCLLSIDFFFPFDGHQDGRWWLCYVLVVTKMTDTGAYFSGKLFGRHKLAAYISPNKTYEGAFGGLLLGILSSWGFTFCLSHFVGSSAFSLSYTQSLWIGAITSFLAQFGDLSESLLKRDMGVKDSSQLPGLGGFLDLLDSVVFTAPFIYIVLKVLYL